MMTPYKQMQNEINSTFKEINESNIALLLFSNEAYSLL